MPKLLTPLIAALIVITSANSLAEVGTDVAGATYQAGTHYDVLATPVRTSNPKLIETAEVFWYGCSHCYSFEPTLLEWKKTLSEDVVLVKSPAIWHPTMELHARAFYTAKALGVLDDMHTVIFEEMNLRKNKLADEAAISKLFEDHGVDPEKFEKTFNSFGVSSSVRQAKSRQRGYEIKGTPEMVVNGKYRITARMGGGHAGMMKIIDYLIDLERQNLPARQETD